MKPTILIILFPLLGETSQVLETPCPQQCTCVHVEGRLTADCRGKNLTFVPEGISPLAMSLFMDNNILGDYLETPGYFFDRGLVNLHSLYLPSCEISELGTRTFDGMSILKLLDLSRNKLTELPPATFKGLSQLKRLDLSENLIKTVSAKMFEGLPLVEEIVLSSNRIDFIYGEAFRGLLKLKAIYLNSNRLIRLTRDVFFRMNTLSIVSLPGNPWICDCMLRDFWNWEKQRRLSEPPRCVAPENNAGKTWNHLSEEDFACAPEILEKHLSGQEVNVHELSSARFDCPVFGDPEPRFAWEFRPVNYSNRQTVTDGGNFRFHTASIPLKQKSKIHTLEILKVRSEDEGIYTCSAQNKGGTAVELFTLRLETSAPPPTDSPFRTPFEDLAKSDDFWLIIVVFSVAVLIVLITLVAVCCYRRGRRVTTTRGPTYSSANGYGYQVIEGGASTKPRVTIQEEFYVPDPVYPGPYLPVDDSCCSMPILYPTATRVPSSIPEDDSGYLEHSPNTNGTLRQLNGKAPLAQGEREEDMKMPLRETAL